MRHHLHYVMISFLMFNLSRRVHLRLGSVPALYGPQSYIPSKSTYGNYSPSNVSRTHPALNKGVAQVQQVAHQNGTQTVI